MSVTRLFVEPGVIGEGTESLVSQIGGERIDGVSAEAIDYAALVLSLVEKIKELPIRIPLRFDAVVDIRPVKA